MVPLKPNVFSIIMDQFPFVIQSIVGALNQGQEANHKVLPKPVSPKIHKSSNYPHLLFNTASLSGAGTRA